MLRENGKHYVLTMYVNRFFHMTERQLDHVLAYKEKNYGKEKNKTK